MGKRGAGASGKGKGVASSYLEALARYKKDGARGGGGAGGAQQPPTARKFLDSLTAPGDAAPRTGTAAAFLAGLSPSAAQAPKRSASSGGARKRSSADAGKLSTDDGGPGGKGGKGSVASFLSSTEVDPSVEAERRAASRQYKVVLPRGPIRPEDMELPPRIKMPLSEWVDMVDRLHRPPKSDRTLAMEEEAKAKPKAKPRPKKKEEGTSGGETDGSVEKVKQELAALKQPVKTKRQLEAETRALERMYVAAERRTTPSTHASHGRGGFGGGGGGRPQRHGAMKFGYDAHGKRGESSDDEGDYYNEGNGAVKASSSSSSSRRRRRGGGGGRSSPDGGKIGPLSDSAMRRLDSLDKQRQARLKRGPSPSDNPMGAPKGGGANADTIEEILAICPHGSRAGDELVVALPDGAGLVCTRVPAGVQPGEEFLVKAKLGPLPEGAGRSQKLLTLIERLVGGKGTAGAAARERLGEQMSELVGLLREAEGDRTKAIAVENLLLDLFGEGGGETDSESESETDSGEEEEEEESEEEESEEEESEEEESEEEESEKEESEKEESEEEESDGSYDEDSQSEAEEEIEGTAIEVVCPPGVQAGDTLEVRVPKKAGGGRVTVRVPAHVKPGEAFEVYV